LAVPSFVVAGTQKAATTWLYECLNEHPEVYVPSIKELHFFCEPDQCGKSRASHGLDWYKQQFSHQKPFLATGEFSIDYMYYPEVAAKLHDLNPGLKVLFILRDPVDRAYSGYWMSRRSHTNFPPFSDFISPDSDIVARGFYHRQIERYRALFPDDQLKILIYEHIPRDPFAFLAEIFNFLGVDAKFYPASAEQIIAETKALNPRLSSVFYKYVSRMLKIPPLLWTWRNFKQVTGIKQRKSVSGWSSKYPTIDANDHARLSDIYREETEKIFTLIGRRIPEWSSAAGGDT